MKYIGFLWLFLWLSIEATDYKTQVDYGRELYNTVYAHLAVNMPDNSSDYVKNLLSAGEVSEIYTAAEQDGYTHIEVIKAAYYIALHSEVIQPSIIKGIRAYLVQMKRRRMIYFYAWNVFVLANMATTIYCARFFERYFRQGLTNINTYYYTRP